VAENAASPELSAAEAGEKERIERTIGSIGGKPRPETKILNALFVIAVCGAFTASLVTSGISRIASIDVGLLLLSLKFAYHLHTEARVNHPQFWILTTLEDRLLDVIGELRRLWSEFRESLSSKGDGAQRQPAPDPPPED
jgi:hypothetical protein